MNMQIQTEIMKPREFAFDSHLSLCDIVECQCVWSFRAEIDWEWSKGGTQVCQLPCCFSSPERRFIVCFQPHQSHRRIWNRNDISSHPVPVFISFHALDLRCQWPSSLLEEDRSNASDGFCLMPIMSRCTAMRNTSGLPASGGTMQD